MANIFRAKSLISRTGVFSNEVIAPNLVYNTGNQNISGIKSFYSRPTVNGTGVLLSGEAASLPTTIVYTTGDQTISGNKTFSNNVVISENLNVTGNIRAQKIISTDDYNLLISGSSTAMVAGDINITPGKTSFSKGSINLTAAGDQIDGNINLKGNVDVNNYGQSVPDGSANSFEIYKSGLNEYTQRVSIKSFEVNQSGVYTLNKTPIYADAQIYISGNSVLTGVNLSSYATTANLALTGLNLSNNITSLSGLFTGYTGNLDATFASDIQLFNTGATLNNSINSFSGLFTGFTGSLDATFASDIQLANTGLTLVNSIGSLSGTLTSTYATITNLASTGSTLDTKINILSGSAVLLYGDQNISGNKTFLNNINVSGSGIFNALDLNNIDVLSLSGVDISITSGNIALTNRPTVNGTGIVLSGELNSTGILLNNRINSLSGSLNSSGSNLNNSIISLSGLFTGYTGNLDATFASDIQLFNTGVTLNTKIDNLSGYINSTSSNIVFTTGNQTISGVKTFVENTTFGDSTQGDFLVISGNNFTVYGSGNFTSGLFVNGNAVLTGVNLSSYATTANLALTGSTLDNKISSLSGTLTNNYATITNLALTGSTLNSNINSLSGTLTSTYATITNLASTGSTLATNLVSTGFTLNNNINSLSGLFTGFTGNLDATYATDASVTTVANNLATTGSTLDTKINTLSGYVTGTNSTFTTNLASTGSTLNTRINNLSGYINSTSSNIVFTTGNQSISGDKIFKNNVVIEQTGVFSAIDLSDTDSVLLSGIDIQIVSGSMTLTNPPTISGNPFITGNLALYSTTINLATTGSTLNNSIISLSGLFTGYTGNLDLTYATDLQVLNTGITLNNSINSLSGTLTSNYLTTSSASSTYATITNLALTGSTLAGNLASTGSTLQTNINNLSNTYATITNLASTGSTLVTNLASTGSTLVNNINSLSGLFTGYTGTLDNTYATDIQLANTGSNLNTKINNLSGVSVLTFGDQNIGGNKTFTGVTTFSGQQVNIIDTALNLSGLGDMTFEGTNINFINSPVFISGTNLRVVGDVIGNNLVYNTGDQNISGTKTFTDGTLNISIKPQNSSLEIDNGPFIIRSAAGTYGAARVEILNEAGANGFTVINEDLDLADFGLKTSTDKKINFRVEGRDGETKGNTEEFQIIDVSNNPNGVFYARFGDNNIIIGENSEKIGVGIDSPISKLHVEGDASNNSTLKVGTLEFQPYSVNNAWLGDNTYYNGGFYRRNAGYAGAFYFQGAEGQFRFAGTDEAGTSYTPAVQLKTHLDGRFGVGSNISTSTSNFTNSKFFVNSNGNVGINTITPSEKLEVSGNIKAMGNINISGNYDIYSQIENSKKLAIAYAIAL
jgi:hypothetical protein